MILDKKLLEANCSEEMVNEAGECVCREELDDMRNEILMAVERLVGAFDFVVGDGEFVEICDKYAVITVPSSEDDVLDSRDEYWDLSERELRALLKGVQSFGFLRRGLVENLFEMLEEELDFDADVLKKVRRLQMDFSFDLLKKVIESTDIEVEELFDVPGFELEVAPEYIKMWIVFEKEREEMEREGELDEEAIRDLYAEFEERGELGVLLRRVVVLGMLELDVEKGEDLSREFGFNPSYFKRLLQRGTLPLKTLLKAQNLEVDVKKVFEGDEELFGVPLEDVREILREHQQNVGQKELLVESFFDFFKDDQGNRLPISGVAEVLGCGRSGLDKICLYRDQIGGYGVSFAFFLRVHKKVGMKLTDIIGD